MPVKTPARRRHLDGFSRGGCVCRRADKCKGFDDDAAARSATGAKGQAMSCMQIRSSGGCQALCPKCVVGKHDWVRLGILKMCPCACSPWITGFKGYDPRESRAVACPARRR